MEKQVYRKSELNPAIKRFIKEKEEELDRTCRQIWQQTNHKKETYLYGSFRKTAKDSVIVTIGIYNPSVNGHFIPAR